MSFTGTGTCVVDADQAGNSDYAAAAQVRQSITVRVPSPVVWTPVAPVSAPAPSSGPAPTPPPAPVRSPVAAPAPSPVPSVPPALIPATSVNAWRLPRISPPPARVAPIPVVVRCEHAACSGTAKVTVARHAGKRWRHLVLARGPVALRAGQQAVVHLTVTSLGRRILPRLVRHYVRLHGHYRMTLTTRLGTHRPVNAPTYIR